MNSFGAIFRAFTSWRMFIVLLLGISSGLPFMLTGATLQAWLAQEKVSLTDIGLFSLVSLPYTLKFLWSPLMDRFVPPFLGRRRGWILLGQAALLCGIACMAFGNPSGRPMQIAMLALIVSFFSASQDIAIDAYRTEILQVQELGPGSGVHVLGYRVGMLISGAVAMILAQKLEWKMVYLAMAGTMLIGMAAVLLAPEPDVKVRPPRTLREAVVLPLSELLRRNGAVGLLIFILIFKLDVNITQSITTVFLLRLGFTTADIGTVSNGFGLAALISGSIVGGSLMVKLGMFRSLMLFGVLQGVSGLSFALLARMGHNYPMMIVANMAENACAGMGGVAMVAFIMSLCDKRFTATQFALLTSLVALSRTFGGTPSGWLAQQVGWEWFFVIATVIAAPGLLLLWARHTQWQSPSGPPQLN